MWLLSDTRRYCTIFLVSNVAPSPQVIVIVDRINSELSLTLGSAPSSGEPSPGCFHVLFSVVHRCLSLLVRIGSSGATGSLAMSIVGNRPLPPKTVVVAPDSVPSGK